jgi:hypothetical protein
MVSKTEALQIFQGNYYDAIDDGDAVTAAATMSPTVDWSHIAAWQSDDLGFSLTALDQFNSCEEVRKFLDVAAPNVVKNKLRHTVTDLVVDGDKGSFLCEVTSAKKPDIARFMVWFELDSAGLVHRYVMRPL